MGHEVVTNAESRSLSLSENTPSDKGIVDVLSSFLKPENSEAILLYTFEIIANFSTSPVIKGSEFLLVQKTIGILQAHPTKPSTTTKSNP
jgi:hypothetical protein